MKKIKSMQQLQDQKKHLQEQQQYLECKMQEQYATLKEYLRPRNLTVAAVNSLLHQKTETHLSEGSVLKNLLTCGISMLAAQIAGKAEKKIQKIFYSNSS
jgi:hypothetical protein